MEQGFDLTGTLKGMASTVPLWLFAWAIFKSWLARSKENKEMIEKQFAAQNAQFKAQNEAMLSIHEKLNQINIKLASQGVDSLKSDLEALKKESVKNEMKIDALFRLTDPQKRASDK